MSTTRFRALKTVTVIIDRKTEGVDLIFEQDEDTRGISVTNCIGYRFLPDTDEMMDAAGCEWQFVAFDFKAGFNILFERVGFKGAVESPREEIGDLI